MGYFKIFIPNLDSLLNQKIIYVGEITTEPETYGNFYTKYNLNLKSTIYNSFIHTINAKVQVIGSKYEKYQKGDIVQVSGVLKSPKSALLPGLFDERKYLFTKGIKYILKADSGSLVFLDRGLVSFFYDRISYLRQKIITVNAEYLKPNNLALINGILLGSKASKLRDDLKDKIQSLGLSHITAASGFNVSILAAGIFYLFKLFTRSKVLPSVFSILAVLLYSSLADFSASVNRAAVFIVLVLIGNLFDKKIKILPGVSLILLLFFVFNPVNVLDIGLQLSVMAFLSILLFSEEADRKLLKYFLEVKLQWLSQIFLQSLFAQIMVIPLIVFYFHNIQILGLISNIVAVPLAAVILILGLTNVIFAFVPYLQILNVFSCLMLETFSDTFLKWVNFLYKFPLKLIYIPNIDFYALLLIYVFILFTLIAFFISELQKIYKIFLPVFVLVFALSYVLFDQNKNLRIFCIPEYNQEKVLVILPLPYQKSVLITSNKDRNSVRAIKEYIRKNNLPPEPEYYNLHEKSHKITNDFIKDYDNRIIVRYKKFVFEIVKNYNEKITGNADVIELPILKKSDPSFFEAVFVVYPENLIVNDYKRLSKKSKYNIDWLKSQEFKTYFLSETGTIAIVSDGEKYKINYGSKRVNNNE
ncbi:MAG: hypothetical protein A3B68_07375 [Candidatus Melainabacteria bacterium RIFCSPHIGHO2_02_FULL_34_12]|nr:MAG: hypothetical protein A3B68_07375 [Candidatus Melainabacteria bacterium RIFCSPHIGHO2_02_FULL_34_12]